MSSSQYFYLQTPLSDLEKIIESFQEDFDTMLKDSFSDDELTQYERSIDNIAAVFVQPIISELSFDDFYVWEEVAESQRRFFENCKSSICLENMPYLQSNSFQVTYLIELLKKFDEVLIDRGGVNELMFKEEYLKTLSRFKTIDSLLGVKEEKPVLSKPFIPVHQIDFFVVDVYKEIERLKREEKLSGVTLPSEKKMKILEIMKQERLATEELLKKSGLNAKDFDDHLEGLKFALKKIL
jgi:hypothetical protein